MRFRMGRIAGIAVSVDASWLLIFALVTYSLATGFFGMLFPRMDRAALWGLSAACSVFFFASVLAHEVAHSVVARRHGIEVEGIVLFLLGGVARMRSEPEDPRAELKVALAGPAASLALAAGFGMIQWQFAGGMESHPLAAAASYLGLINLVVVIFNMVPGFPLDGGRVLRALIWWRAGDRALATGVAANIGQAFGIILIAAGLGLAVVEQMFNGAWFIVVGWFLADAARGAHAQVQSEAALSGTPLAWIVGDRTAEGVPGHVTLKALVETRLGYHSPGPVPVLADGQVDGLVGLQEVKRVTRTQWPDTTAREAMVPLAAYPAVNAEEDAWDAFVRMCEEDLECLVVVEDGRFRGVVNPNGLLRVARDRRKARLTLIAE